MAATTTPSPDAAPRFAVIDGLLTPGEYQPSPNHDERPEGVGVDLVVLHCISLPPGQFGGANIDRLFLNRLPADEHRYFSAIADLRVSAHLLIRRDGAVVQYVNLDRRAWHAGKSSYDGREACNDFSVGIELEGAEDQPFEAVQYRVLAGVVAALREYFPALGEGAIVGHADVAPGRKTDPGPYFKWELFREMAPL